jgi:transglutaminase-like putative cysteine protease
MTEPTFSLPIARGLAFAALAGFGALHWMALLEPAEPGRALSVLGAAALAPVGLLAAARLGGRARTAAAAAVAVPVAALGLLAGGVADEYLRPDEWGTLAAAIGRGVESLPGVRVPYRGVDETIRLVIGIGGTLLVCAAALVAFWPRRRGTGYPAVALGLLVALYAIPVVVRSFENEFLRGAALALLVVAFLRLEKLRPSDAGAAGIVVTGVAVLALMMAPALDRDAPWWDYERWAFAAVSARSTAFGWDHDYGPLDWPRDGRELLRVRSRRPLYWKAANLTEFDGTRWVHGKPSGRLTEPDNPETLRRGRQRIRVTIRNLTSETFVTAGYAERVDSTVDDRSRGDGTWTAGGRLRLGDAYRATVYEPDATQQMRQRRPPPVGRSDDRMTTLVLPVSGRPGQIGTPKDVVTFPAFGDRFDKPVAREARGSLDTDADATDPARALDLGPYRRTWRLAQRLKGEAKTQEDLVQSVLAYVRRGFRYTETPRPAARNLDGFLFDAKAGYCQQFSGAMALLLRMTGVPARVATGFTPGSLDRDTGEWVVRDLDAHSWVEVWYPGLGWETFDPTPAASPARSQPNEGGTGGGPSGGGAPSLGGDLPADPGRRGPAPEPGSPWGRIALVAVAAVALLAATVLWVRRRRRAAAPIAALALGELERALRRTRRHPGAGATLRSLEAAFARSPAAAGYVRAIRNMRYAHAADPPTRAQRRALRGELARGAGLAGRLRAWWALPPLAR